MAVTMPWGEAVEVTMELGFPVNGFTLNDPTLGQLNGIGKLDGALEGIDVTDYVTSIGTNRGRPDQLQNFTAGTASIMLKNFDRRFDPTNEASPYWDATTGKSGVTPRRKVTISSGGDPLFAGRITDIDIGYEPVPVNATTENSFVTITAADDFVLLANAYTEAAITPTEEFSGDRVTAVLDLPEVDYPATRDIETGVAILGGGATYEIAANSNILSYLNQVATAEQGYFYVSSDGTLTFTKRISAQFSNIAAEFSDDGTGLPYRALSIVYGQEFLYNKVICSIVNGTEQIADDLVSQADYGISALNLSALLLSTDAQALTLAEDLLGKYANPEFRFDRIASLYNSLTSGQRTTATSLDIGAVVQITRNFVTGSPTEVVKAYSIEGIRHSITANDHSVEFLLAPVTILNELTLDDAILGRLDENNALAESDPLLPFFFDQSEFDSGYSFQ